MLSVVRATLVCLQSTTGFRGSDSGRGLRKSREMSLNGTSGSDDDEDSIAGAEEEVFRTGSDDGESSIVGVEEEVTKTGSDDGEGSIAGVEEEISKTDSCDSSIA